MLLLSFVTYSCEKSADVPKTIIIKYDKTKSSDDDSKNKDTKFTPLKYSFPKCKVNHASPKLVLQSMIEYQFKLVKSYHLPMLYNTMNNFQRFYRKAKDFIAGNTTMEFERMEVLSKLVLEKYEEILKKMDDNSF